MRKDWIPAVNKGRVNLHRAAVDMTKIIPSIIMMKRITISRGTTWNQSSE
jgi:hypothetical protein